MLEITGQRFDNCDGLSRRNFLRAGFLGLGGMSLSQLLAARAEAAKAGQPRKATSVIFLELAGGPSQFETYDPKPEAPVEYRGPYSPVKTNVPGVWFSETLSHQAQVMDRLAVLRGLHHDSASHRTSSHLTQTGYYLRDRQNNENEMPCIGSVTAKVRGPNASGVPPYVTIPTSMRFGRAAYLGKGNNPFPTGKDPNREDFQVPNLKLVGELDESRLADRRALLTSLDATRRMWDRRGVGQAVDQFVNQAFEIVTGERARAAFDLTQESDQTRDAYGRTATGQSMLLARRLVESGVTFVSIRVGGWDQHWDLVERLEKIRPGFDQGMAALVKGIYERGLDEDVLVVAMGEFGRTPRMNNGRGRGTPGRDHWGRVMSGALSGGGLNVGQVIGASNSKGEVPVEAPYRPENILAMVYRHLGIDPKTTFADHTGRPRYLLERRELITELV